MLGSFWGLAMGGREVGNTCRVIDMGPGFEACAAWACIAGIHFFRRRGASVASFSHEFTFLVQMQLQTLSKDSLGTLQPFSAELARFERRFNSKLGCAT